MAAAVDAIEANPSTQMVELRDLVGMTTKRLTALFRAEIGLSPKAYARIRRLQAALRLLGWMSGAAGRGRGRLFRPGSFRPGIPFLHRHDADAVHRAAPGAAQPRACHAAAQISKTAGHGSLMIGPWTTPDTR